MVSFTKDGKDWGSRFDRESGGTFPLDLEVDKQLGRQEIRKAGVGDII